MNAVAAFATVALAACAAGVPSGTGAPAEVRFEVLFESATSGLDEPRREVIRDPSGWAPLWAQINRGVTPTPDLPAVDFSRSTLIAVASGTRRSGGFAIQIRSMVRRGEKLEVTVLETCPAPGSRVSLGLTQPAQVVRLDRFAEVAEFRDSRTSSCR